MYFRAQVTYEVAQLRKVADANATELQQERDHSAALASELATVRRDFETTAALSSKAADEVAQLRKVAEAKAELKRKPDHTASLQSAKAPAAERQSQLRWQRKLDPDEPATLMNRAKVAAVTFHPPDCLERAVSPRAHRGADVARTYDLMCPNGECPQRHPDPALA